MHFRTIKVAALPSELRYLPQLLCNLHRYMTFWFVRPSADIDTGSLEADLTRMACLRRSTRGRWYLGSAGWREGLAPCKESIGVISRLLCWGTSQDDHEHDHGTTCAQATFKRSLTIVARCVLRHLGFGTATKTCLGLSTMS